MGERDRDRDVASSRRRPQRKQGGSLRDRHRPSPHQPPSTHPSPRLPPPPSSRQRRGSGRCGSRRTAAVQYRWQYRQAVPAGCQRQRSGTMCFLQRMQTRLHPSCLPPHSPRPDPLPESHPLDRPTCMLRAMRCCHQAKPSASCAFQSYSGLPQSCPVSLNASGGTPLQERGDNRDQRS